MGFDVANAKSQVDTTETGHVAPVSTQVVASLVASNNNGEFVAFFSVVTELLLLQA